MTRARLTGGGGRVVWGAGLFALGGFADAVGLTGELSGAVPGCGGERAPVHDRGRVLAHGLLMLAGGGQACSDMELLRGQRELFGVVASVSTLRRVFHELGAGGPEALLGAAGRVRGSLRGGAGRSARLVLDVDSTLVEVHSENKAGAAPHFRGGFGFHPMVCSTADGEPLWVKLRPGNAAANDIADHLEVIDGAVSALAERDAAGHREGDDARLVRRPLAVRLDSAGCSARLAVGLRARNIGYFMCARSNQSIQAAIRGALSEPGRWQPARPRPRQQRSRSQVADLSDLVDLDGWPDRTRLMVRREPLHPGAQRSLFDSDRFRYHGFLTDQKGSPARLDEQMRRHADIENAIRRLKDSGLARMPFTDRDANAAWAALCITSAALVRWFQTARLTGELKHANPKRLRAQLWHIPAVACTSARRTLLRLPDGHPGTRAPLAAAHPR